MRPNGFKSQEVPSDHFSETRLIAALIGAPAFFKSSDYNPDFPGIFVLAFKIKKCHGHVIADGPIKRECFFASAVKTEWRMHYGFFCTQF